MHYTYIHTLSLHVALPLSLSLTSSAILPHFPSTLHPLYHSLLHQFSLNSLRLFIHFITNFFINSPSIPFDSSPTLSLTSSSILPQFPRSEEHTSELQSLMRISYAVFCLKKKNKSNINTQSISHNTI